MTKSRTVRGATGGQEKKRLGEGRGDKKERGRGGGRERGRGKKRDKKEIGRGGREGESHKAGGFLVRCVSPENVDWRSRGGREGVGTTSAGRNIGDKLRLEPDGGGA